VETLVAQAYPDFAEVLRRFGSPPIRSTATLAGNIANGSPIGDSMPCLMALGATLVLRQGERQREVALDRFYTGQKKSVLQPGELIEAVVLPKPRAGQVFRAHKISKRFEQDISATCAALSFELVGGRLKGVRLAYNGLAPSPCRAPKLEALLEGHSQTESRRRLFDSVLSNVTAGVIGLDAGGRVDFINPAATRLLDVSASSTDRTLEMAVPEFSSLFARLRENDGGAVQEELRLSRRGKLESLLVRMTVRRNEEGEPEGYVVAFDDVTDLVSAQRMAAWGDVARRIAHEIKNPLTPIQLAAERLQRKYGRQIADDPDTFATLTGTIGSNASARSTASAWPTAQVFTPPATPPEPPLRAA
jgi:PAS domain-containing protein